MFLDSIFKNIILGSLILSIILCVQVLNLTLLLAIIFYLLVLYFSFFMKYKKFKIFQQIFIFLNIFWIIFRLLYLLFEPGSFNYNHIIIFNSSDFAFTLFYLACCSIIFFLTISSLSIISKEKRDEFLIKDTLYKKSYLVISVYFLIILIENFLVDRFFPTYDSYFIKLISVFFSIDLFVILFSFYFIYFKNQLSKKFLIFSYVILFTYIVFRLIHGSKSGLFIIFLNLLVGFLLLRPRLFIKIKHLFISVLLIPFGFLIFVIGTVFRFYKRNLLQDSLSSENIFENLLETYDRLDYISTFSALFDAFSKRISMLDYMHVLVNKDPVNDYLGLTYAFKSFFNVLAPRFISDFIGFGDVIVLQANLFVVAYGLNSYAEVVESYHTDMLPLFGYLFLNFGFILSLIVIFFGLFLVLNFYNLKFKNNFNTFLYKGFFLIIFIDLMFGMGLVATFQQIIFFYIFPLIFYKIFKYIYIFFSRFKIKIN